MLHYHWSREVRAASQERLVEATRSDEFVDEEGRRVTLVCVGLGDVQRRLLANPDTLLQEFLLSEAPRVFASPAEPSQCADGAR